MSVCLSVCLSVFLCFCAQVSLRARQLLLTKKQKPFEERTALLEQKLIVTHLPCSHQTHTQREGERVSGSSLSLSFRINIQALAEGSAGESRDKAPTTPGAGLTGTGSGLVSYEPGSAMGSPGRRGNEINALLNDGACVCGWVGVSLRVMAT